MSSRDERIEIEDLPADEGVSRADAAGRVEQDPEEQRNFTETHPEHARRDQRVFREDGSTD